MSDYTELQSGLIRREVDGATIPLDADNTDYAAYLAWFAAGNRPATEAPPPAPVYLITKLQIYGRMSDAELEALDGFVRNVCTIRQRRSWDDLVEIASDDNAAVMGAFTAIYGAVRAAELLGPVS